MPFSCCLPGALYPVVKKSTTRQEDTGIMKGVRYSLTFPCQIKRKEWRDLSQRAETNETKNQLENDEVHKHTVFHFVQVNRTQVECSFPTATNYKPPSAR